MKTIVVCNAKGGVGKTTTAVTVAELLTGDGRMGATKPRVLLLDTDPQGSATLWVESGSFGFDVAWETDPQVLSELRRVAGYDYIVVDTQPALKSEGLRAVLSRAEYALLPTQAEAMDYPVLMDTLREVVWPMGKAYRVLLTLVDPRTIGEAKAMRNELQRREPPAQRVETFETIVRLYRAHRKARLEGQPITSYKGPRAWMALRDYRKVVDELLKDLEQAEQAGEPSTTAEYAEREG
jgi:chromosome partitioning protein